MDGGFLNDSPSDASEGSERDNRSAPSLNYEKIFKEQFPYYLAIGMSYQQFWNDDCELVKYYRKAEELKKEQKNQEMWMQGMYFYDALIRVSPIFRAYAKKGTKPDKYVEEPYPINKKKIDEAKERKERETFNKGVRFMQAFMESHNKQFKKGGK